MKSNVEAGLFKPKLIRKKRAQQSLNEQSVSVPVKVLNMLRTTFPSQTVKVVMSPIDEKQEKIAYPVPGVTKASKSQTIREKQKTSTSSMKISIDGAPDDVNAEYTVTKKPSSNNYRTDSFLSK